MNPDDLAGARGLRLHCRGLRVGDTWRPRIYTPEQYFKSQDEMAELFADLPEAPENAEIAGVAISS